MASKKENSIVVYWAPCTLPDRQTSFSLLFPTLTPLHKTLPKSKPGGYSSCGAASSFWKNIYTVFHPFTSTATVSGDVDSPTLIRNDNDVWMAFPAALDGYRIDCDYSFIFFCEEPLMIQQTPPYLHNTSDQKTGRLAAGSFDISKWFRAITLPYMLWPEETSITVTEGEPMMYVQFLTDKKVILKRFEYTSELKSIADQLVNFKHVKPLQPLKNLYKLFVESKRNKLVSKLIKDNLLE